jgi:vancomycin resistance protein YoaR
MNLRQHAQIFIKKLRNPKSRKRFFTSSMWFVLGAGLGFFFFISFLFIYYRESHTDKVYAGVMVNGIDFGGKTKDQVRQYYDQKNKIIAKTTFRLNSPAMTATISARQISFGYDAPLLAQQAYSIGRSDNVITNMSLIWQAYTDGVALSPAYNYSDDKLTALLEPLIIKNEVDPAEGLFNFEDGKIVAIKKAVDGRTVDAVKLKQTIKDKMQVAFLADKPQTFTINVPITAKKPLVTPENAAKLGIKELIAQGTSLFQHSIENRVYNISLAASRLNGVLIPPGKVFSVDDTIGDISVYTGYKQAYVIQNGKTILGDGGGVCQVSTTLFRAALNAGLPIVERHPHAYRVGYYEQDSGPGIDAAIYTPTVDLKFKNDTGHYILIQTATDTANYRLTFYLYGTKDNRVVAITDPVVSNQTPAPTPLYQDDPTLPKGTVKQVDFSADGANVYFTRTVKKDGKVYLSDKFVSNYRPWQAVYMKGTQ